MSWRGSLIDKGPVPYTLPETIDTIPPSHLPLKTRCSPKPYTHTQASLEGQVHTRRINRAVSMVGAGTGCVHISSSRTGERARHRDVTCWEKEQRKQRRDEKKVTMLKHGVSLLLPLFVSLRLGIAAL